MPEVYAGNAGDDNIRGWFIGRFLAPASGLRHQEDLELKWGIHSAGESRPQAWGRYNVATTICILVRGRFLLRFRRDGREREVLMEREGDYVIMPPQVDHSWQAVTDSVVLSVRFPSVPDDQVNSP